MNAVIANKYRNEIKGLGIEIAGLLEGNFTSDEIISAFSNFYYEHLVLDVTSIKEYNNTSNLIVNLKKIFTFLDPTRTILLLEDIAEINNKMILSKIVETNIYNFTFDINEIKTLLVKPKVYTDILEYANYNETESMVKVNNNIKVIGVKNVTEHAGATTLIYMMYQELLKNYRVKCLEVDKDDFKYFYNEDLKSIRHEAFMDEFIDTKDIEVILVDMNNYENEMILKDILYVLEPSVLKLNKAIGMDANLLNKLSGKKIVLNRTNISLNSAKQFESESKLEVFDILRNLNERDAVNPQIMNLLIKLGFNKTNNGVVTMDDTERKKTLFD